MNINTDKLSILLDDIYEEKIGYRPIETKEMTIQETIEVIHEWNEEYKRNLKRY